VDRKKFIERSVLKFFLFIFNIAFGGYPNTQKNKTFG
jgi:hypothetical protein